MDLWEAFLLFKFSIENFFSKWEGAIPANIKLFKVNNKNARKRCEICSKVTIKTPERRHWLCSGVFIVTVEHISHLFLVFLWLTLNNQMLVQMCSHLKGKSFVICFWKINMWKLLKVICWFIRNIILFFFFHFTHPEILHQHNGCYRKYETQHWAGMGWCSLNIWEDMEHTCARYVGRICMTIHFYVGSIFCQLNELEILLPRFRSQYLFKVNYENTRTMCEIYSKAKGMTSVTSCWCFDRYLRTYFTHFSGVSIVD